MAEINQNKKENEQTKISPLGIDEINSVIKSFKNSSFNQENLYKKDKKNFIKKSLFELAKESEKDNSDETQSKTNFSDENIDLETSINSSEEIIDEIDNQNNSANINSKDDFDENKNPNVAIDALTESNNENSKIDQQSEENVEAKNQKLEEEIDIKSNILDDVSEKSDDEKKDLNQKPLDAELNNLNKIEYEEKTLEALDSVREAVTKSLEENNDEQKDKIEKDKDSSNLIFNDTLSEINYINALFKNIREISDEEIEKIIKSKVIELAEGVIGYQIEKLPEKFVKKIKNSIKEIKTVNDDIKIYLNDQDYEILNKFVESNDPKINFKLDLDSSLGRGDFTIDMGGVVQSIKYKKVIE